LAIAKIRTKTEKTIKNIAEESILQVKRMMRQLVNPFSPRATKFLEGWLCDSFRVKDFPKGVQEEFAKFKPLSSRPVRLFRSTSDYINGEEYETCKFTSWTYDLEVAKSFHTSEEEVIISCFIFPKDFLIDTTLISREVIIKYLNGYPDEKEVIVNPGVYYVSVVEH